MRAELLDDVPNGKRPVVATVKVADPPDCTVPESKLRPSSAVTECGALSPFVTPMRAPWRTVSVAGENLKSLMAIDEPACDGRPGAGALAVVPPPPPQPARDATAATAATRALAKVRRVAAVACEES